MSSVGEGGGKTVLMVAVTCGHMDIVKHLATVPGVDWDTKNDRGKTALEVARELKLAAIEKFFSGEKQSSSLPSSSSRTTSVSRMSSLL